MTDLPPGWAWTTLGELAAPEPRSITDGPFGSNLTSAHYTNSGARVIRLQNIGDGEFRDERAYISLEHFEKLRNHEAVPGDLIVASLGDSPPRVCLLPELDAPTVVKADCIRVRLDSRVEPRWVLYALQTPGTKQFCAGLIQGVGRPRLGLSRIREIPVPVAPLAVQRRIVATLDEQFSRIRAGTAIICEINRRSEGLQAAIRDQASPLDPEGRDLECASKWESRRLGELLSKIEAGKSFGGRSGPARSDEWGIIRVSAMTWGDFDENQNKRVGNDNGVDVRHEINEGDILLSRANTVEYVGAAVLVRRTRSKLLLSDKSLRLVPNVGVDRRWLVHALSSTLVRRQISKAATGTKDSMRNISQVSLRNVRVLVPSMATQRTLANLIEGQLLSLDRLRSQLSAVAAGATLLQRSLLSAAFGGGLAPRDPEDEPASVLLDRIRAERDKTGPTGRRRRASTLSGSRSSKGGAGGR